MPASRKKRPVREVTGFLLIVPITGLFPGQFRSSQAGYSGFVSDHPGLNGQLILQFQPQILARCHFPHTGRSSREYHIAGL